MWLLHPANHIIHFHFSSNSLIVPMLERIVLNKKIHLNINQNIRYSILKILIKIFVYIFIFKGKVERQKSSDKTLSKAPSIETKKPEK